MFKPSTALGLAALLALSFTTTPQAVSMPAPAANYDINVTFTSVPKLTDAQGSFTADIVVTGYTRVAGDISITFPTSINVGAAQVNVPVGSFDLGDNEVINVAGTVTGSLTDPLRVGKLLVRAEFDPDEAGATDVDQEWLTIIGWDRILSLKIIDDGTAVIRDQPPPAPFLYRVENAKARLSIVQSAYTTLTPADFGVTFSIVSPFNCDAAAFFNPQMIGANQLLTQPASKAAGYNGDVAAHSYRLNLVATIQGDEVGITKISQFPVSF